MGEIAKKCGYFPHSNMYKLIAHMEKTLEDYFKLGYEEGQDDKEMEVSQKLGIDLSAVRQFIESIRKGSK